MVSSIVEVPISKSLIDTAMQESAKQPSELRNSITYGEGTLTGYIGKFLVCAYLGVPLFKTYHYDMLYKDRRIQVKTKRCSSVPMPHYECSISDYNPDQICDFFVFTRVLNDRSRGWILGYLPRATYFQVAQERKKDEYDSNNNFAFHCNSYNLAISQLYPMEKLVANHNNKNTKGPQGQSHNANNKSQDIRNFF